MHGAEVGNVCPAKYYDIFDLKQKQEKNGREPRNTVWLNKAL